jgi:ficolin
METNGGGWTVIQRRMDGSQEFYLYWMDYQKGFGKLNQEFWLGLDKINRLTIPSTSLRVDMEDFDGHKKYAQYRQFHIDNAVSKYTITVTNYSGNAGDSLIFHNQMKFSTRDKDNDISNRKCARRSKGAWWYRDCHASNLNGQYLYGQHSSYADGVNWNLFKGFYYSLRFTEMKVRRN